MTGTIPRVVADRGFGFIKGEPCSRLATGSTRRPASTAEMGANRTEKRAAQAPSSSAKR